MTFSNPGWLLLLILVCGVVLPAANRLFERRRDPYLVVARRWLLLRSLQLGLLSCGLAAIVLCLAGPSIPAESGESGKFGRDVVIAVDVSPSMLARDISPSRLEAARLVARRLVEQSSGNRIALVAFAGASSTLLPLTTDRQALELFIDNLDVQVVDEPGTVIDRAILRSVEILGEGAQGPRFVVLMSDGEDHSQGREADLESARHSATDRGVAILALGIGTERGATIPIDSGGVETTKLDSAGNAIVTQLDEQTLMAVASDDLYFRVSSGTDLTSVADEVLQYLVEEPSIGDDSTSVDLSWLFLVLGIVLLAIDYTLAAAFN